MMRLTRAIDDAVIERLFQPAVNRLGIAEPADAATLVYGTAAASVLVRILLDHLGGTLAEGVLNSALAIAATCAAYGLSFVRLKGRAGLFHRTVPALLILRVSGVVLLAYLAVILFAGALAKCSRSTPSTVVLAFIHRIPLGLTASKTVPMLTLSASMLTLADWCSTSSAHAQD